MDLLSDDKVWLFINLGLLPRRSVGIINRRIWKIVRMPVSVFGTFFLFATPIVAANIYNYYSFRLPSKYGADIAYDTLKTLAMFHTWVSFFVYVLQDRAFRSVLKSYFAKIRCEFRSKRVHPSDICKGHI